MKTAAESHRLLLQKLSDFSGFKALKSAYFDIKDNERPGQSKKFDDEQLEALLDADSARIKQPFPSA